MLGTCKEIAQQLQGNLSLALFSSQKVVKFFQDSPSHRILRQMHGALNESATVSQNKIFWELNKALVARKLGLHFLAVFSAQQQIILRGWPISVGSKGYNCTTVEEISVPLPHK